MATVSAAMVKELREKTGAGMMDCKKALTATEGDMDKAIDFLREKGLAAAAKKADRVAAEGVVASFVSEDAKVGVIVEINCETDFVAKNEGFMDMVKKIAAHIAKTNPKDLETLLNSEMEGQAVSAWVTASIAKIGENINVRRFVRYEEPEGMVSAYIHGGGKIGVLVKLTGCDAELGKDIAMQVAAANPSYLCRDEVSAAELEHEKEVLSEQAKNEGKPANIIEKMVIGRINKFYKEICLLEQPFIKDPDLTVEKMIKAKNKDIAVAGFARFQLGEGIEKKADDFAAEVMAAVK
jgi:elongation factor Ts